MLLPFRVRLNLVAKLLVALAYPVGEAASDPALVCNVDPVALMATGLDSVGSAQILAEPPDDHFDWRCGAQSPG
jgi:hypothetical protein